MEITADACAEQLNEAELQRACAPLYAPLALDALVNVVLMLAFIYVWLRLHLGDRIHSPLKAAFRCIVKCTVGYLTEIARTIATVPKMHRMPLSARLRCIANIDKAVAWISAVVPALAITRWLSIGNVNGMRWLGYILTCPLMQLELVILIAPAVSCFKLDALFAFFVTFVCLSIGWISSVMTGPLHDGSIGQYMETLDLEDLDPTFKGVFAFPALCGMAVLLFFQLPLLALLHTCGRWRRQKEELPEGFLSLLLSVALTWWLFPAWWMMSWEGGSFLTNAKFNEMVFAILNLVAKVSFMLQTARMDKAYSTSHPDEVAAMSKCAEIPEVLRKPYLRKQQEGEVLRREEDVIAEVWALTNSVLSGFAVPEAADSHDSSSHPVQAARPAGSAVPQLWPLTLPEATDNEAPELSGGPVPYADETMTVSARSAADLRKSPKHGGAGPLGKWQRGLLDEGDQSTLRILNLGDVCAEFGGPMTEKTTSAPTTASHTPTGKGKGTLTGNLVRVDHLSQHQLEGSLREEGGTAEHAERRRRGPGSGDAQSSLGHRERSSSAGSRASRSDPTARNQENVQPKGLQERLRAAGGASPAASNGRLVDGSVGLQFVGGSIPGSDRVGANESIVGASLDGQSVGDRTPQSLPGTERSAANATLGQTNRDERLLFHRPLISVAGATAILDAHSKVDGPQDPVQGADQDAGCTGTAVGAGDYLEGYALAESVPACRGIHSSTSSANGSPAAGAYPADQSEGDKPQGLDHLTGSQSIAGPHGHVECYRTLTSIQGSNPVENAAFIDLDEQLRSSGTATFAQGADEAATAAAPSGVRHEGDTQLDGKSVSGTDSGPASGSAAEEFEGCNLRGASPVAAAVVLSEHAHTGQLAGHEASAGSESTADDGLDGQADGCKPAKPGADQAAASDAIANAGADQAAASGPIANAGEHFEGFDPAKSVPGIHKSTLSANETADSDIDDQSKGHQPQGVQGPFSTHEAAPSGSSAFGCTDGQPEGDARRDGKSVSGIDSGSANEGAVHVDQAEYSEGYNPQGVHQGAAGGNISDAASGGGATAVDASGASGGAAAVDDITAGTSQPTLGDTSTNADGHLCEGLEATNSGIHGSTSVNGSPAAAGEQSEAQSLQGPFGTHAGADQTALSGSITPARIGGHLDKDARLAGKLVSGVDQAAAAAGLDEDSGGYQSAGFATGNGATDASTAGATAVDETMAGGSLGAHRHTPAGAPGGASQLAVGGAEHLGEGLETASLLPGVSLVNGSPGEAAEQSEGNAPQGTHGAGVAGLDVQFDGYHPGSGGSRSSSKGGDQAAAAGSFTDAGSGNQNAPEDSVSAEDPDGEEQSEHGKVRGYASLPADGNQPDAGLDESGGCTPQGVDEVGAGGNLAGSGDGQAEVAVSESIAIAGGHLVAPGLVKSVPGRRDSTSAASANQADADLDRQSDGCKPQGDDEAAAASQRGRSAGDQEATSGQGVQSDSAYGGTSNVGLVADQAAAIGSSGAVGQGHKPSQTGTCSDSTSESTAAAGLHDLSEGKNGQLSQGAEQSGKPYLSPSALDESKAFQSLLESPSSVGGLSSHDGAEQGAVMAFKSPKALARSFAGADQVAASGSSGDASLGGESLASTGPAESYTATSGGSSLPGTYADGQAGDEHASEQDEARRKHHGLHRSRRGSEQGDHESDSKASAAEGHADFAEGRFSFAPARSSSARARHRGSRRGGEVSPRSGEGAQAGDWSPSRASAGSPNGTPRARLLAAGFTGLGDEEEGPLAVAAERLSAFVAGADLAAAQDTIPGGGRGVSFSSTAPANSFGAASSASGLPVTAEAAIEHAAEEARSKAYSFGIGPQGSEYGSEQTDRESAATTQGSDPVQGLYSFAPGRQGGARQNPSLDGGAESLADGRGHVHDGWSPTIAGLSAEKDDGPDAVPTRGRGLRIGQIVGAGSKLLDSWSTAQGGTGSDFGTAGSTSPTCSARGLIEAEYGSVCSKSPWNSARGELPTPTGSVSGRMLAPQAVDGKSELPEGPATDHPTQGPPLLRTRGPFSGIPATTQRNNSRKKAEAKSGSHSQVRSGMHSRSAGSGSRSSSVGFMGTPSASPPARMRARGQFGSSESLRNAAAAELDGDAADFHGTATAEQSARRNLPSPLLGSDLAAAVAAGVANAASCSRPPAAKRSQSLTLDEQHHPHSAEEVPPMLAVDRGRSFDLMPMGKAMWQEMLDELGEKSRRGDLTMPIVHSWQQPPSGSRGSDNGAHPLDASASAPGVASGGSELWNIGNADGSGSAGSDISLCSARSEESTGQAFPPLCIDTGERKSAAHPRRSTAAFAAGAGTLDDGSGSDAEDHLNDSIGGNGRGHSRRSTFGAAGSESGEDASPELRRASLDSRGGSLSLGEAGGTASAPVGGFKGMGKGKKGMWVPQYPIPPRLPPMIQPAVMPIEQPAQVIPSTSRSSTPEAPSKASPLKASEDLLEDMLEPPPQVASDTSLKSPPKPEASAKGKSKNSPPTKGEGKAAKGEGKGKDAGKAAREKKIEPRKPDVKPGVHLKRLYWSSFRCNAANTVWNQIDQEGAEMDTNELEELFCDAPTDRRRKRAGESQERKVAKLQVYDPGRRRQVCVMLARLPPKQEVLGAIQVMDEQRLDRDQVELLLLNAPPPEEVKLLQKGEEENVVDEYHVWDTAEDFMLALIKIDAFRLRLQVWDFHNSFQDRFDVISRAQVQMAGGCEAVLTSKSIRHLLALVLYVGNYLNGGTARGRADGFAIDTLLQMKTVKMAHQGKQGSLVDYIVSQMERHYPGELAAIFAPAAEVETIRAAARPKLIDFAEELSSIKSTAERLLAAMEIRAAKGDKALEKPGERLRSRISEAEALRRKFDQLKESWTQLCVWFYMEDKSTAKTTDEFFGIWETFLSHIGEAREAVEKEKADALKRLQRTSLRARTSSFVVGKDEAPSRSMSPWGGGERAKGRYVRSHSTPHIPAPSTNAAPANEPSAG